MAAPRNAEPATVTPREAADEHQLVIESRVIARCALAKRVVPLHLMAEAVPDEYGTPLSIASPSGVPPCFV